MDRHNTETQIWAKNHKDM